MLRKHKQFIKITKEECTIDFSVYLHKTGDYRLYFFE